MSHHQVVIVGGGMAGLAVADRLVKESPALQVAILEPSVKHDYQRLWMMVAGGVIEPKAARRDKATLIPAGATWIQDSVEAFYPGYNSLVTAVGENLSYDYLIVAPGMQVNWDGVVGLRESIGKDGVCSVYSHDTAASTWEFLRSVQQGVALFTQPTGVIKCWAGSQQVSYLAEQEFRRRGIRDQTRLVFLSGQAEMFPVNEYCKMLEEAAAEKGVETRFGTELVEIRPATKEAVFRQTDSGKETMLRYDLLHVAPPMGPLAVVANSELADPAGWVDVDRQTLQHVRYPNVFSLGDASSLPTVKTGSAIRHQTPVLVSNLFALIDDRPLTATYDGYTGATIVTGYDHILMAEFDYSREPIVGSDSELLDLTQRMKSPGTPAV